MKLKDVPEVTSFLNKVFVINGAILYYPPVVDSDIGHNVCAIKVNNEWEVYDDNDSKSPNRISSKADVIAQILMYVISEET